MLEDRKRILEKALAIVEMLDSLRMECANHGLNNMERQIQIAQAHALDDLGNCESLQVGEVVKNAEQTNN